MSQSDSILEALRCPNGCDTRWLQPLYHEDHGPETTSPRRVEEEFMRPGSTSLYDLGLRCAECGLRYGVRRVPSGPRQALLNLIFENRKVLTKSLEDLVEAEKGTA